MKKINSLISVIVLIVMLVTPQMNVSAADVLTWGNRQDMPTARYSMGVAVGGGKIYVIGGDNYSCTPLTNVEEYDPATNIWSIRASMPTGRWTLGAATGPDGKIYAIGGAGGDCGADVLGTVERYDPVTDTWESRTSLLTPRAGLGVAAATNGKIYAMGGYGSSGLLDTVEEYDPATDTWTTKSNMPLKNRNFAVTAASNGKVYVFGGYEDPAALLEYDPASDTWQSLTPNPYPHFDASMVQAPNGKLYITGGQYEFALNAVQSYNPKTNTWSMEPGISTARMGHSMVAIDNTIYVLGGLGGYGPISSVEAGTIVSVPSPVNDNLADATVIPALPFSDVQDTTWAGTEYGEPQYCVSSSRTVWYSFTPTSNVSVLASMTGSNFNTNVVIYEKTADGLGGLRFAGCATGGFSFIAHKGVTYYLQVGTNDIGDLHLDVLEEAPLPPPPANDDFDHAVLIDSVPFNHVVTITYASREPGEPQNCDFSPRTVWYRFTPTTNADIRAGVEGSSISDTILAAYQATASGLSGLNAITCNTNGGSINFNVEAGGTYYIQVGNITSPGGELHLNVQGNIPPPNDDFASAKGVGSLPFDEIVDMKTASMETKEPISSCASYGNLWKTIWYAYTPKTSGWVAATVSSATFWPVMTAYTGDSLENLTEQGCRVASGNEFRLYTEAGKTYYFQVGKYQPWDPDGYVQFRLEAKNPPVNDNFDNAVSVGSLPFSEIVDISDASIELNEPRGCYNSNKTVWYAFTPTTNMLVEVDTAGSDFSDTNINVYQAYGSGMSNLSHMLCAYYGNSGRFSAQANVTYYIQAGSIYTNSGNLMVNIKEIPRPANDDIANAFIVDALPYSHAQDTSTASNSPDDPVNCTNNGSVWYRFTATSDSLIDVDTFGSNYDTVLSVYTGERGSLTQVTGGCNDDYNGMQSRVTFAANPGTTYYFLVGRCCGYGGSGGGNLQLNVKELIRPANDDFANAKAIDALPFMGEMDISNATTEPNEPQYCNYSSRTVWYSFTPSANMLIQVDTSGSSFYDSFFNIYQAYGTAMSDLNHMYCSSYGSPLIFTAQAGMTYYIQAGSMYGSSGTLRLNVQELPRPANDDFANAKAVLKIPFDDTVDTKYATGEINEPIPFCAYNTNTPITHTIWYAFTPTESGSISASVPGIPFTPIIAAYTGTSLSNLTQVGCQGYDGNILTIHVNVGTTYYFQVGNYYNWEAGGEMNFHVEPASQPVAGFNYFPQDPSIYDTVQFCDSSYDPGWAPIQFYDWDFGDGATTSAITCPSHQYAKDGDYTVQLSIRTVDGRTATATHLVQVRTRDVAITKLSAPQSASPGQTRTITVSVNSKAYSEKVKMDLYRSIPGGFEFIKTLTLDVPARASNRTVAYTFNYTFTSRDASMGKVTFYAVATIVDGRDSYPADNEAYSLPTKVNKRK